MACAIASTMFSHHTILYNENTAVSACPFLSILFCMYWKTPKHVLYTRVILRCAYVELKDNYVSISCPFSQTSPHKKAYLSTLCGHSLSSELKHRKTYMKMSKTDRTTNISHRILFHTVITIVSQWHNVYSPPPPPPHAMFPMTLKNQNPVHTLSRSVWD